MMLKGMQVEYVTTPHANYADTCTSLDFKEHSDGPAPM